MTRLVTFMTLPLFAYFLAVVAAFLSAGKVPELAQAVILSIPLALVVVIGAIYLTLVGYRAITISHENQIYAKSISYEWAILNNQGDLEEQSRFVLHNSANSDMRYLDNQYTSFPIELESPLEVRYSTESGDTPTIVVVTSLPLHYERKWNVGSDNHIVHGYNWKCEFDPPLRGGTTIALRREYCVNATEVNAFSDYGAISYIPEWPAKLLKLVLHVPIEWSINIDTFYVTDQGGNKSRLYSSFLGAPKHVGDSVVVWVIHYPISGMRYGFKYRLEPRLKS